MDIRKTWNWGLLLILPAGYFILGYIGMMLQGAWWIMCLLWLIGVILYMRQKCRCPKCRRLLTIGRYPEIYKRMLCLYYWPSSLKLKCIYCGHPLNGNDDKNTGSHDSKPQRVKYPHRSKNRLQERLYNDIRKIWNWGLLLILPAGYFILGYIGMMLQWAWLIMCLLWLIGVILQIRQKRKCPKCRRLLTIGRYPEIFKRMLFINYWPSSLKLKCIYCGHLLNESDDENTGSHDSKPRRVKYPCRSENRIQEKLYKDIRKTWNLWRLLIFPASFLLLGCVNIVVFQAQPVVSMLFQDLMSVISQGKPTVFPKPEEFSGMFLKCVYASIVGLLWCAVTLLYIIPQRCKCPDCKRPFRLYKYPKLAASIFMGWYWPSDLELECIHCGQLLHASDDKNGNG